MISHCTVLINIWHVSDGLCCVVKYSRCEWSLSITFQSTVSQKSVCLLMCDIGILRKFDRKAHIFFKFTVATLSWEIQKVILTVI